EVHPGDAGAGAPQLAAVDRLRVERAVEVVDRNGEGRLPAVAAVCRPVDVGAGRRPAVVRPGEAHRFTATGGIGVLPCPAAVDRPEDVIAGDAPTVLGVDEVHHPQHALVGFPDRLPAAPAVR